MTLGLGGGAPKAAGCGSTRPVVEVPDWLWNGRIAPPPGPSDGRPRHGGGWGDINIHIDINMNIDIHIIINMNNNFGVGDHFQVLRVSEGT